MSRRLTDGIVKILATPPSGNKITYDGEAKGFGCRVTAGGARSFILNYRTKSGLERRYTIGRFPNWKTDAARKEARTLKAQIDLGGDPVGGLKELRAAPTVDDLCKEYRSKHMPKKRVSSRRDDESMLKKEIEKAAFHRKKVADVTFSDIDALHRKITVRAPYRANRVVSLLSKMFGIAVKSQWRADNPAKGIERNPEVKRRRYLNGKELMKLIDALVAHEDRQAANIVRLLVLTGARRGEVLSMRWSDLDMEQGVWTKPGATTKQKTEHRVPLSAPARQLLAEIHAQTVVANSRETGVSAYVFPSGGTHRVEIKKNWATLCAAAGIVDVRTDLKANGEIVHEIRPSARIHDLRHTYASILASSGQSLPIIGALLGHTQASTTQRYAHLLDEPLRQATEKVGAIVAGDSSARIFQLTVGKS